MSNLARELQDKVRTYISDRIPDITILSEDQKDIEYEIKNALGKQGIVTVVMTPTMSYIGHDGKYLVWQVDELTIMTTEYVPVNRAKNKESYKSGFDIAFVVNDVLAGPDTEIGFGRFCPDKIEQGEDSGLLVTKSTFSTTIQFYDEPVPPPVPTTGESFDVNIAGTVIEAKYSTSSGRWEWTGPGSRSRLELWYDDVEKLWKCKYAPNPFAPSQETQSSQPIDAKEITFDNGWTAVWKKSVTREGTMTADFTDDFGNPIIATWSYVGWNAMTLGYTLHIEYVNGRWSNEITDSHGNKWTLTSDQDPSDKVITFSGDNPIKRNQTWTWSE